VTLYLDTSNLVKLYIDEPGAIEVQQEVDDADVVVTSALAYPETRATFARRRRERLMTVAESRKVLKQFDADWKRFFVLAFTDELALAAGQLADAHGIRGADAVHLASFETLLANCDDDDVRFSCADGRLTKAARVLGVPQG
jgi:uncharacterized protein with PIN domain